MGSKKTNKTFFTDKMGNTNAQVSAKNTSLMIFSWIWAELTFSNSKMREVIPNEFSFAKSLFSAENIHDGVRISNLKEKRAANERFRKKTIHLIFLKRGEV